MSISKLNAERYYDPTAYEALSAIEKEEKFLRTFRPIVYICSPYAGDIEKNVEAAQRYSRFAVDEGYIPIAPHLLFPQFLNDHNPKERHGSCTECLAHQNHHWHCTETVQQLFIRAYNQLMQNRPQIIKDCMEWRRVLIDFTSLDEEIARQTEEAEIVAELVKAAVKENASTALSQETYIQKYETLTRRYEAVTAELDRLQGIRVLKNQQDKQMALFIRTLKKQPDRMDSWNDTIWTVMVEKAIVLLKLQIPS